MFVIVLLKLIILQKVFNNCLKNTFKYIKKSNYEEIYFPYYDRFENCDYEFLNYNSSFGGVFQATEGYYKLYFADYKEIDSKNKIFLNWYKKAFNVLAMFYNENNNTIYVIKRSQKNNFTIAKNGDITIVYGNNKQFIKGHLSLDYINRTSAEDLNIEDYVYKLRYYLPLIDTSWSGVKKPENLPDKKIKIGFDGEYISQNELLKKNDPMLAKAMLFNFNVYGVLNLGNGVVGILSPDILYLILRRFKNAGYPINDATRKMNEDKKFV